MMGEKRDRRGDKWTSHDDNNDRRGERIKGEAGEEKKEEEKEEEEDGEGEGEEEGEGGYGVNSCTRKRYEKLLFHLLLFTDKVTRRYEASV